MVPVSLPMRCRRVPAPFSYKNDGRQITSPATHSQRCPNFEPALTHQFLTAKTHCSDYRLTRSRPFQEGVAHTPFVRARTCLDAHILGRGRAIAASVISLEADNRLVRPSSLAALERP